MPWLDDFFQRVKAPFAPDSTVLDAKAVELFSRAAALMPGYDVLEAVWLRDFYSKMQAIEVRGASITWLNAVENNSFLLDKADRIIQSLRTALVVDISGPVGKPKLFNVRTLWSAFVSNCIVSQSWDISHWPAKDRWFEHVLSNAWSDNNERYLAYQQYAETMAAKHLWARDKLLAHRMLYIGGTQTLSGMFQGPASSSVSFITALTTVFLRMHQRSPLPTVLQLHSQAHMAWPAEMEQLEATVRAQALLEGVSLEQTAALAKAMESGDKGYSAYFILFAQSVHALIFCRLGKPLDTLELPILD